MIGKLEVATDSPTLTEFKCVVGRCIEGARQLGIPDTDICLELLEQVRFLTVRESLRIGSEPEKR